MIKDYQLHHQPQRKRASEREVDGEGYKEEGKGLGRLVRETLESTKSTITMSETKGATLVFICVFGTLLLYTTLRLCPGMTQMELFLKQNEIDRLTTELQLARTRFTLPPTERTVVFYAYIEKDQHYIETLQYFLEVGVSEEDPVDYYFIIQGYTCSVRFPNYTNVFVIRRENVGYDFGAYAHAIETYPGGPDTLLLRYAYFIIINASVRGPFLPAYWPPPFAKEHEKRTIYHWSRIFTSMLSDTVKLVGPSLFCLIEEPLSPIIEGYFAATDRVGFEALYTGGVFSHKE